MSGKTKEKRKELSLSNKINVIKEAMKIRYKSARQSSIKSFFAKAIDCHAQARSINFWSGEAIAMSKPRRGEALLGGSGGMPPRKILENIIKIGAFWGPLLLQMTIWETPILILF